MVCVLLLEVGKGLCVYTEFDIVILKGFVELGLLVGVVCVSLLEVFEVLDGWVCILGCCYDRLVWLEVLLEGLGVMLEVGMELGMEVMEFGEFVF